MKHIYTVRRLDPKRFATLVGHLAKVTPWRFMTLEYTSTGSSLQETNILRVYMEGAYPGLLTHRCDLLAQELKKGTLKKFFPDFEFETNGIRK